MSRVLLFLQALIIIGAITSLIEPRQPYRLTQLFLVSHGDSTTRTLAPDQQGCFKVALTVLGLALL